MVFYLLSEDRIPIGAPVPRAKPATASASSSMTKPGQSAAKAKQQRDQAGQSAASASSSMTKPGSSMAKPVKSAAKAKRLRSPERRLATSKAAHEFVGCVCACFLQACSS